MIALQNFFSNTFLGRLFEWAHGVSPIIEFGVVVLLVAIIGFIWLLLFGRK